MRPWERRADTIIIETHSEQETEALGERLIKCIPAGQVVALFGDLGMGKTALVRGMARGLSIRESVSSPTFTVVNEEGERVAGSGEWTLYAAFSQCDPRSEELTGKKALTYTVKA